MTRPPGDSMGRREQGALRISMVSSVGFGTIAIFWGLAAGSQVILLDGIFTPLELVMTWGSIQVSRVVAKGPTARFPFGREALVPLFVGVQAVLLGGGLIYAVCEAVRVIRAGGSEVTSASLAAYGAVSAAFSLGVGFYLRRSGNGLGLIEAEAAGWLSGAVSSLVIVAGGILVVLLRGTPLQVVEPFADSVLVIICSVLLLALPIRMLRRAILELQSSSADPELEHRVRDAVDKIRELEHLPEPILRTSKVGNTLSIEAAFVLPAGEGDVDSEDRVRRGLRDTLADLPHDIWIVVEFTHDEGLLA